MIRPAIGDWVGGFTAAALLLPQAMAFGLALWLPLTHEMPSAAMSGIVTAIALSLASGLAAGTAGLVSAPTGPTFALLSGTLAVLAAKMGDVQAVLAAVSIVILLAGLLQLLLAALHLGHLVKFMPYPVVSGFMTGTGVLMITSQWPHVLGSKVPLTIAEGGWIPLATVLTTMLASHLLPRHIPRLPGPLAGLLVGIGAFHLFAWGKSVPDSWMVGALPGLHHLQLGIRLPSWSDLPWQVLLPAAMALAILGALDTLLTSVVADLSTGERHASRRELLGQGCGHVLAALLGGMAGAGTSGATLAAIQGGGRRHVGIVVAACLLGFVWLFGDMVALLPVSVLSGIVLDIALFGLLDRDILLWLRTPHARGDALIALSVVLVTLWSGLMMAVVLGVALAAIAFIRQQAQVSVVLHRWDLRERSSLRRRDHEQRQALQAHADKIVGYVLHGSLFFGTADHLLERLQPDIKRARFVILDMRRLGQVDLTGLRLIEYMCGILRQHGGDLLITHPPKSMGLVKRKGHRHERMIPYHRNVRLKTFANSDAALEYAEDQLLRTLGFLRPEAAFSVPLRKCELLRAFDDHDWQKLAPSFNYREYRAKEVIFDYQEQGDALYILLSGDVLLRIPTGRRKGIALARYGPGMAFGEVAFLHPGPRSAEARALSDCKVALITHARLRNLCRRQPELGMRLLLALGHDISRSLRAADGKIRHLAEF
ncbi:MAG: STAS domain-containing protein [Zetaproteobacteria bacterium]|nr:MAG: STAS domain-containing protein [Zetaproteobacteria bacterium]